MFYYEYHQCIVWQLAAIGDPERQLELQADLQEVVERKNKPAKGGKSEEVPEHDGYFSDLVRVNQEAQVRDLLHISMFSSISFELSTDCCNWWSWEAAGADGRVAETAECRDDIRGASQTESWGPGLYNIELNLVLGNKGLFTLNIYQK